MAASELMSFCATEFQGFFLHIGTAIKQFHEHGSLPPAAFQSSTASGLAGKADKKPKIKRKAVAYNIFVKEKMEQLKASGLKLDGDKNNNELFKLAVSEWKKLTDAERKQYTEKFKVALCEASVTVLAIELHWFAKGSRLSQAQNGPGFKMVLDL